MADSKFADNPWSAEHWNLTRQGDYVRKYGVEVAKTKARQAGVKFGAQAPVSMRRFAPLPNGTPYTVIVQRRNIGGGTGNGGGTGPNDVLATALKTKTN
jgi:hypothetical protein